MHIKFKMEGGIAYFPGLNKVFSVDTAELESQQVSRIESMIHNAHFFDLPSTVGTPAPGAADYRTYTITVEDGRKSHVVQVNDPVDEPALQELIEYLQTLIRSRSDQDEPNR